MLTAVVNGAPVRQRIGGTGGVAVDASGIAAFSLGSADTAPWAPGKYQWIAFGLLADGNRDELAQGVVRIDPDPAGTNPADTRSYNEKVLASIRSVIAGTMTDDVMMYKIGGRELTKIPRETLLKQLGIFEARVRNERRRNGERVPSKNIGIQFEGRC